MAEGKNCSGVSASSLHDGIELSVAADEYAAGAKDETCARALYVIEKLLFCSFVHGKNKFLRLFCQYIEWILNKLFIHPETETLATQENADRAR
jgi:hypothetical protein